MIRIDKHLIGEIRSHAEHAYPHECCGALLGRIGERDKEVTAIERVENRRGEVAALRRYLITADDYRELEASARRQSLDIIGFYHSHPDHPAQPSSYDREHALPWYSYIIVSVNAGQSNEVNSWVLQDNREAFKTEAIV